MESLERSSIRSECAYIIFNSLTVYLYIGR